jgi:hypothetical protein
VDKIDLIPHGIPDVPFADPNYYKDKFGVEGRPVLLTPYLNKAQITSGTLAYSFGAGKAVPLLPITQDEKSR